MTELFPPRPVGLRGRAGELAVLTRTIREAAPTRLALVGAGGSGKSMLAAELAYAVDMPRHWFRVGAWDYRTLAEMLALRFRVTRDRYEVAGALRRHLSKKARLIVLDNHEDDAATARLLDTLSGTKATFVITARRCLLAGVLVFPVTAPLVTSGESAFPRVAALTRKLRWNPLALDIADSIVGSKAITVVRLGAYLAEAGVDRVRVIDHEDDIPDVGLLVAWAWERLTPESRRMLGLLAWVEGDHVDLESLAKLARARARDIEPLKTWHLVQESMPGRFALHAVVKYAVQKRTKPEPGALFTHYVELLERHPERLDAEQTHLFAAMDHAHRTGDLGGMLRVEQLTARLAAEGGDETRAAPATSRKGAASRRSPRSPRRSRR